MLPLSFILGKKRQKINRSFKYIACLAWRKIKLRSGTVKQYKN